MGNYDTNAHFRRMGEQGRAGWYSGRTGLKISQVPFYRGGAARRQQLNRGKKERGDCSPLSFSQETYQLSTVLRCDPGKSTAASIPLPAQACVGARSPSDARRSCVPHAAGAGFRPRRDAVPFQTLPTPLDHPGPVRRVKLSLAAPPTTWTIGAFQQRRCNSARMQSQSDGITFWLWKFRKCGNRIFPSLITDILTINKRCRIFASVLPVSATLLGRLAVSTPFRKLRLGDRRRGQIPKAFFQLHFTEIAAKNLQSPARQTIPPVKLRDEPRRRC